ncbi:MAG TPA: hypothetical protein VGR59_11680 [Gemmatimonadaceae bacterium]|nr:hypothetical protein [Gemmatimonadaceae bacterium]
MKRSLLVLWLVAVGAAGVSSACTDGTAPAGVDASSSPDLVGVGQFTTVDVPGATATVLFAINDDGVAVGRYASAGVTHGFVRSAAGELSTIDFPGAGFTVAGAINNRGDIVGWYTLPTAPAVRHGFLLKDGAFTSFDPPGSIFTNVLGVNDRSEIVGRFCTRAPCAVPGSGDFHGFLLSDGQFTILDVPGSNETNAWKTNDRGETVGGFGVAGGDAALFLFRDGTFTTMALPDGKHVNEDTGGINALGDIVGQYCDASPCLTGGPNEHGFVLSNGLLTTIDIPGATVTGAFGINARRQVVGGYFDAAGVLHGYLLQP